MTDVHGTPPAREPRDYPARSRMLDAFAADIAGMMAEGQLDSAERSALALPHIAISLADAALLSSRDAYRDWCIRWVQPDFGGGAYEQWAVKNGECQRGDVPFTALRTLRLQRRLRTTPSSFARPPADPSNTGRAITCALLGAVFRWYEQEGRYTNVVQTNLARLGVLR